MEIVKPEHVDVDTAPRVDTAVDTAVDADADPHPTLLQRLLSWRPSTRERALDRDPTLWMHRDVTA